MEFTLTGFTQNAGFRVFVYEGVAKDRMRTQFTVRADLSAIRKYNIRLQELPLMCRMMLEHCHEEDPESALRAFTFTEDLMDSHYQESVALRDAAAARKKSPRRVPKAEQGGEPSPWRQGGSQFVKPVVSN